MSLYEPGMTDFRYRYRYNADGQRYHKQAVPYKAAPGPAQYYALDGNTTVGFFGQSGGSWNILTPSGEVIGRMTTGGAASYYLKDHLGSVRAVVNASGAVLETRDHYPYGLEMPGRSLVSGTKTKENFTGHELDDETGLIYAGARYYLPNIGRWTSPDPLNQYASPYVYVGNNPLRYVDPTGLWGSEPHASTSWMGSSRHGLLSGGLASTELISGRARQKGLQKDESDRVEPAEGGKNCPPNETCDENGRGDSNPAGIGKWSRCIGLDCPTVAAATVGSVELGLLQRNTVHANRAASILRPSRGMLSRAAYPAGAYLLWQDYQDPTVSTHRLAYRSGGLITAWGAGLIVGGSTGAIVGGIVGGAFLVGEFLWDSSVIAYDTVSREVSYQYEASTRAIKRGWAPFRR